MRQPVFTGACTAIVTPFEESGAINYEAFGALIEDQIARGIDGDNQGGVASVIAGIISAVVSVVLEYLNYCSLGWVFLHSEQSAFKSTCDGAVIYFQNWKTLMKNSAKVIAITLVSLALIGGAFFGLFDDVLAFGAGAFDNLFAVCHDLFAVANLIR